MAGMNNPPGTPRDDGEMAGNFLNPFQSESVSTVSYDTQKKHSKCLTQIPAGMRLTHALHVRWS